MTGPPKRKLPCELTDPDTWFPASEASTPANDLQIEIAKAHCFVCPIQEACLEWALEMRVEFGIWGGQTATERRATLRHGFIPRRDKHSDHRDRGALVRELASQA